MTAPTTQHRPQLYGINTGLNRVMCSCGERLGEVPTSAGMHPVRLLMAQHRAGQR
jgi:hypothetical protein